MMGVIFECNLHDKSSYQSATIQVLTKILLSDRSCYTIKLSNLKDFWRQTSGIVYPSWSSCLSGSKPPY